MAARRLYGRRSFLKSIGLSASLAPFVPCLDRIAEASPGTGGVNGFPRRLLLTFAPNGTIESLFWPTGSEEQFTFPAGQITEPLAPYRSSLIFPKNLTRPKPRGGGPHEVAMASLWTGGSLLVGGADSASGLHGYGYGNGPSIDQIILNQVPQSTPFPFLALGVANEEATGGNADPCTMYMTYAAADTPIKPYSDPYAVFNALMLSGGGAGPVGPGALDQVRLQRKSVIDLVLGELGVLNTKIDAGDRAKVQGHIAGLRDIERRLQSAASTDAGAPAGQCTSPMLPTGFQGKLYDNDSFPALVQMQTDLVVAALACDQTRIATMQWSRTFSMIRHTWLDPAAPAHHVNSHLTDPVANDWQARMSKWYCQQFADLLGKLRNVKEGNGTLLDNMLVVWGYDMNLGAGHILPPAIAVLAGGLGGAMKLGPAGNGRLIDYAGAYDWTQLLVTICHAMGASSVASVGDLGVPGTIPNLLNV